MPFVTEELWQRLPRRADQAGLQTIMLAPYPQHTPEWQDPQVGFQVFAPFPQNLARTLSPSLHSPYISPRMGGEHVGVAGVMCAGSGVLGCQRVINCLAYETAQTYT